MAGISAKGLTILDFILMLANTEAGIFVPAEARGALAQQQPIIGTLDAVLKQAAIQKAAEEAGPPAPDPRDVKIAALQAQLDKMSQLMAQMQAPQQQAQHASPLAQQQQAVSEKNSASLPKG